MRNKKISRLLLSIMMLLALFIVVGCQQTSGEPSDLVTVYSVTFELNYRDAPAPEVVFVDNGEAVTMPSDPVRAEYEFGGWYQEVRTINEFDPQTLISENTVVFAKWNLKSYDISFNLNYDGAPTLDVLSIQSGQTITQPDTPTRDGFIFNGWTLDAAGMNEYDFSAPVSDDTTLYAQWLDSSTNVYTVTFNYNYADSPDALIRNVNEGSTVSIPNITPREGYQFDQWYTDAAGTTPFNFTTPITENTELYAGWKILYSVTFEQNYEGSAAPVTVQVVDGGVVAEPTDPQRFIHDFLGWFTDEAGTQAYNFDSEITGDITLYAAWEFVDPRQPSENVVTNVFEAEYIEFEDAYGGSLVAGDGWSGGTSGTSMIAVDNMNRSASNGYFVTYLFSSRSNLRFNIYSDRAVTGATLTLRLSAEGNNIVDQYSINPNTYAVVVNGQIGYSNETNSLVIISGTQMNYNQITFSNLPPAGDYLTFTDYAMTTPLNLNQGWNTIDLVTYNTVSLGGTTTATAPLVDAIKISNTNGAVLSWTEFRHNLDIFS